MPSTSDRLYALDLARFIAMLFMIQGHVLDALVRTDVIDVLQFPWTFWHAVRGLTAPAFLMVSGAVHVFANKRDATGRIVDAALQRRIRWGLTIIGIGYLMVFPADRVWDIPFVPAEGWRVFNAVNILHLTGAAMLLFVVVMRRTRSIRDMGLVGLGVAIVIAGLSPFVAAQQWYGIVPGWVEGYLTTSQGSIFPMFTFGAYIFVGVYAGSLIQAIPQPRRMYVLKNRGWIVGCVIVAIAYGIHAYLLSQGMATTSLESASSPLLFCRRVGFVLVFFSFCVWLFEHTQFLREWYSTFGKRSLYIYVIHLALLWGTPWWDGIARSSYRSFSLAQGVLAVCVIMTLTLVIAWVIDRFQILNIRPALRTTVRYAIGTWLAYLLFT